MRGRHNAAVVLLATLALERGPLLLSTASSRSVLAMSRLAVLLRGINVGGNNTLPMAQLRTLLEDLGYSAVKTLLNSGNAVVTTDDAPADAEKRVSAAIKRELGLSIEALARTHQELDAVVKADPLRRYVEKPSWYVVAFLRDPPTKAALASLDPTEYEPERWQVLGRELYVWYANGQAKTKIGAAFFEKKLKVVATARNWNTVVKLHELTA